MYFLITRENKKLTKVCTCFHEKEKNMYFLLTEKLIRDNCNKHLFNRHVITTLLEQIPDLFRDCRETELLYLPVIQAAVQALTGSNRAGKLMMFHSGIPSYGPGTLKTQRDDRKLIGTDKEKVGVIKVFCF